MSPKRPAPPMYGRVQRKVAPPVHRVVVQQVAAPEPAKPQMPATPVAAPSVAPVSPPVVEKTPEKKAGKKTPPKPPEKSPKAAKKEPAKKKPKWDEDMTQKELYQIAKKAGLDVKSKDWKHEIIAALKKAGI